MVVLRLGFDLIVMVLFIEVKLLDHVQLFEQTEGAVDRGKAEA